MIIKGAPLHWWKNRKYSYKCRPVSFRALPINHHTDFPSVQCTELPEELVDCFQDSEKFEMLGVSVTILKKTSRVLLGKTDTHKR